MNKDTLKVITIDVTIATAIGIVLATLFSFGSFRGNGSFYDFGVAFLRFFLATLVLLLLLTGIAMVARKYLVKK